MKIEHLAAIVDVRNHIFTVLNDRSVTARDEVAPLDRIRIALDKKFVEALKETSIEDMFIEEVPAKRTPQKKATKVKKVEEKIAPKVEEGAEEKSPESQLPLKFSEAQEEEEVVPIKAPTLTKAGKEALIEKAESTLTEEEEDLAAIQKRIAEEKAKLKAEGRSNKKKTTKKDA